MPAEGTAFNTVFRILKQNSISYGNAFSD